MKKTLSIGLLAIIIFGCNKDNLRTSKTSGYAYEVYADAPGRVPDIGDYVYFHMDILQPDGELLQTYRNQKVMPSVRIASPEDLARIRNPIVDILASLSVGDSVGIIVPTDSIPGIPPEYSNEGHLIYRLVVKQIMDQTAYQQKMAEDQQAEAVKASQLKERLPEIRAQAEEMIKGYRNGTLVLLQTENGVRYLVHEEGTGDLPLKDRMVTVQYFGALVSNGEPFDTSFESGRGYTFRIGRGEAIKGWDEAIPNFKVGTKASIFIPSELGYGARGFGDSIPPDSELYFYVEIEEVFF